MAATALPLPVSPVKTQSDRGRKHRKRSEAELEQRPGLVQIDSGNSSFYTKVPLNSLDGDEQDANSSAIKRQATIRVKKMSSMQDTSSRFPKLNDCAHFHYDHVELTQISLTMHNDPENEHISDNSSLPDCLEAIFTIRVTSKDRVWLIKRSYEDFRVLDKQLHSCIYDRRYSQLVELPKGVTLAVNRVAVGTMLCNYLSRFSQIAGDMINCGPVLNWMETDNHGNHVIANEESAINIPAVAAAHVTKRYIAQAPDEISLEVGDMISVIDMPPPEETSWWRGKNGFDVGFFPSQCIELIGEHLPLSVAERVPKTPKPVLRKQGKLILFLRSFILARPTKKGLKERGILRERVFSCDLGEHLLNSGSDVPMVIRACTEFIEEHGVVDGIYRQSGVASNVQKLRDDFDCDIIPDLSLYQKDIHCVSSVCKLYFRELPNPLLTYQLYKNFEEAAMSEDEVQLYQMHDTVQQLPPPHYRTLEFLIRHLAKMSTYHELTGMNVKNLAIVWAPNLLRSKDIEVGSCAAFMEIKVQATVVEYLIRNVDIIFNDKLLPDGSDSSQESQHRPKSLVLSAPPKLLSLEEARARSATIAETDDKPKYIEVGGGPSALPKQYHTVIDLPYDRKRLTTKSKKSPVWRAFFSRKEGKRKEAELSIKKGGKRGSLRAARSEESLSSTESGLNYKRKNEEDEADTAVVYRRSRSSSVAGVESFKRSSSHDSFFELDPQVVAAATRDFIESTASAQKAKHQEDRESRKSDDRSSPRWIDQSISSAESETFSPGSTPLPLDTAFTAPILEAGDNAEYHQSEHSLDSNEASKTGGGESKLYVKNKDKGVVLRRAPAKTSPQRRDVHVQTPTDSEFPADGGPIFSLDNLDGAVLGSASPRKSAMFRSPVDEAVSPTSPRYSLDAVLSEYDTLIERYGNQAATPDFLTSSDSLAAGGSSVWEAPLVPAGVEHSANTPIQEEVNGDTKRAPIASADSTSSSDFTPVPPPRRKKGQKPLSPSLGALSPHDIVMEIGPEVTYATDHEYLLKGQEVNVGSTLATDPPLQNSAQGDSPSHNRNRDSIDNEEIISRSAFDEDSLEHVCEPDLYPSTPANYDNRSGAGKLEEGCITGMDNLSVDISGEEEEPGAMLSDMEDNPQYDRQEDEEKVRQRKDDDELVGNQEAASDYYRMGEISPGERVDGRGEEGGVTLPLRDGGSERLEDGEDGVIHALPGETVIISDVIEL